MGTLERLLRQKNRLICAARRELFSSLESDRFQDFVQLGFFFVVAVCGAKDQNGAVSQGGIVAQCLGKTAIVKRVRFSLESVWNETGEAIVL